MHLSPATRKVEANSKSIGNEESSPTGSPSPRTARGAGGEVLLRLPDLLAILFLIVLCWLFFWRLLTPNPLNEQSLVEGDFSGQFVAFAQYQAVRLAAGEVPLWNPYNNGGHPFLADTQSAVFYPPRLVTIALLNMTGGSTPQRMYDALQKEMILHTLIASLLMYALLRRLTLGQPYSVVAGLIAGITFAYGGYLTSYPQLQLAVMGAGVWLPLALLGIHEATRHERVGWRWFLLAGFALGLSFLAGHPQTTLFFIYTALAYLGYRCIVQHHSWRIFFIGAAVFGLLGAGLAAVQLIPGWEYSQLTARSTLNFDALGNGFPFQLQVIFPGFISVWSPLYFGIVGLALAIYAIWRRVESTIFWLGMGLVALAMSLGHGTILYDVVYNIIPGFTLFREQERMAYIVAVAASILAGLGTVALLQPSNVQPRRYKVVLWTIAALPAILSAGLFVNWLIASGADGKRLGLVIFTLIIAVLAALILTDTIIRWQPHWRACAIVGLVIFDLFSFGRSNPNVEAKPVSSRLNPSPLVQAILADKDVIYRVDGAQAIGANFGTLYGIMDIQGISPLRLVNVERLLKLPPPRLWEALAVRYVPTSDNELPIPSHITAKQDNAPHDPINLHRLDNPRPYARLVYHTWIEPNDDKALGVLAEPSYDARGSVLLPTDPGLAMPTTPPAEGQANVTTFKPESVTIQTTSSTPAILSISQVYYPGWQATIDGQSATLLRADTALMAVAVPSGDHTVQLDYRPASYSVGAAISLITIIVLALGALSGLAIPFRRTNPESTDQ